MNLETTTFCQNFPKEICEKKEDGIIYSIYPKKGAKKGWHKLWYVCGSDQDLDETRVVRTVNAGSLEKPAEHLVPDFLEGDLSYIDIFLCTYRTYTTTQHVLDLLF
ncbi:ral guanine nucleotide dissociation stimulator-like [Elephas maximus indicus]|uniref:ral guanine nucleotide dissociation stimulator-like n=1 Tax=Elephas maximus indicus TaxID=99487 RepID=UPI002116EC43|nr:ral guanine nucleotide dissociation stimulator-like [Elephas maximus indicus]